MHTSVRQQTVAFVSSHVINTGSLIQARIGGAFIDICLAVGTYNQMLERHSVFEYGSKGHTT